MPTRTESADVVVVGCGPGGAVLAYLLARSGVEVALIERAATFEREYRGFGWSPGVARLFDQMDVLGDVLDLAHETLTEGRVSLYGEAVSVIDLDRLDTDYPFLLMMEQPALLEYLVRRASAYEPFTFHPSTTVTDLIVDETGAVAGVVATDRAESETVRFEARVVVGADGRYSTVREAAGIDAGLFDSPIDLVWFKLPRDAVGERVQGQLTRHGILVSFGLGTGEIQFGYPIPAGTWPSVRDAGFDAFCARVAAVDPRVGAAMGRHLDGFRDTTLLDVSPGTATSWTRDGLLLIGDAAHVASPIGAQGNPLAVEDAVVAHDVLVRGLQTTTGPLPSRALSAFEDRRRPVVASIIAQQRRAAAAIAWWLDNGHFLPPWLVRGTVSLFGHAVARSRRVRGLIASFSLGDQSVAVAREHFQE